MKKKIKKKSKEDTHRISNDFLTHSKNLNKFISSLFCVSTITGETDANVRKKMKE